MAIKLKMGKTTESNDDARKQADSWLNIGYTAENADGEEVFVGLPMGIALDTMKESAQRGSTEDFRQLIQAKNSLLAQLQEIAANMEPGATDIVDLQIQIRRVATHEEPAADSNPLMSGVGPLVAKAT